MKSKIIFTIFICASIAVIFLVYRFVQERYYSSEEAVEEETTNLFETIKDDMADDETETPEEEIESPDEETEIIDEKSTDATDDNIKRNKNGQAIINKFDCSNNCEKFQKNEADFKYCKQICGLFPIMKKENPAECANLSGTEKDFCLRELAVTKNDFKICDEINDKKIKDSCNNRLIEDIFDKEN